MVANRSFAEYVKKRFDNNFWVAAKGYLDENYYSLGLKLKRIHRTRAYEIIDVKVEYV